MDAAAAGSYAIRITRLRELLEIGPDELLLGCLWALARFGVARLGPWTFDLATFGIDWLEEAGTPSAVKVSYSDAAVAVFDRAARIARVDGCAQIQLEHLLVAFADEETGLMSLLKPTFGIDGAAWRLAAAGLAAAPVESPAAPAGNGGDYLTPEEAAADLGIHVQTLRAYVRSGKLPALRLAGERALRIRRADLDKVLEPLVPEKR